MSAPQTANATWHATGKSNRPWHKNRRWNKHITHVPRAPQANAHIPHARAIARARGRINKTLCLKEIGDGLWRLWHME